MNNPKMFMSKGAHEVLFGVVTGAMQTLARKIKNNRPLDKQLFAEQLLCGFGIKL